LEIPITRPETWFSHETPTIYPSVLLTRPIPTRVFVDSLRDLLGQAWLDGAKSLIDPRINNGQDRLPLWVITYWKHVNTLVEKQKKWKSTLGWLENEKGRAGCEHDRDELIRIATNLFNSLEWDSEMKYVHHSLLTIELARFLGTLWLSDNHINMMVEELTMQQTFETSKWVQIATLSFADQVGRVGDAHGAIALSKKKVFHQYETDAKEGRLEKLYFPLHVNANHWIAGVVDFGHKRIVFGT
jgi:hypothetical protein